MAPANTFHKRQSSQIPDNQQVDTELTLTKGSDIDLCVHRLHSLRGLLNIAACWNLSMVICHDRLSAVRIGNTTYPSRIMARGFPRRVLMLDPILSVVKMVELQDRTWAEHLGGWGKYQRRAKRYRTHIQRRRSRNIYAKNVKSTDLRRGGGDTDNESTSFFGRVTAIVIRLIM
jgi:hypothetical protein